MTLLVAIIGERNNVILKLGHIMLVMTPLAFFSGFFNCVIGLHYLAWAEWSVGISSIYYWSDHTNLFKRKVDMTVVYLSLITHMIYTYNYSCYVSVWLYSFGIILYGFARVYNSNFFHACMWIVAIISNIGLTLHIHKALI
jgi:hypothetical protein